jgi:hypothetical protein
MPRRKVFPPRPSKPFRIGATRWNLENAATHTRAGFSHVAADIVQSHYFRYVSFLQSKQYLIGAKAQTLVLTDPALEHWSNELTLEGYRFVQYSHDRWIARLRKYVDTIRENAYLDKWHRLYLQLPASAFADGA